MRIRSPSRSALLAAVVAAGFALLVGACAPIAPAASLPSSPSPSAASTIGPTASPAASADTGAEVLSQDVGDAMRDPSMRRLASVGEAFDLAIDHELGLDTAPGPEPRRWLIERRSAIAAATLDDARIDYSELGPTAVLARPIAARGPVSAPYVASGGMAWIGAIIGAPLALQIGLDRAGETFTPDLEARTSTDAIRNGDLETVATTTMDLNLSVSGSTVIAEADMRQDSTTTNVTNGQVVVTSTYRTFVRAEINACPDANGGVTLKLTIEMTASVGGALGSSSYEMHATAEVQGTVGDDAYLASETSTQNADYTVTPSSGPARTGSGQRTITSTRGAGGTGGTITSANETLGSGTMSAQESSRWQNAVQLTSVLASANGLAKAQSVWRSGKCVTIEASENSRKVRPREHISFTAQPKHAIEGNLLDKPVEARFTGLASLSPIGVRQMPLASFDFVAGPRERDRGTVMLESTSNRGIGRLDVTFEVAANFEIDAPSGSGRITGKKCGGIDGLWEAAGTYHSTLGGGITDGEQAWAITVDETSMMATYTYVVHQTMKIAGITVFVEGDAAGTASVSVDDDGVLTMHLTETRRAYRSWTSAGGEGSSVPWSPPEPLSEGELEWQPGATCP